MSFDAASVAQLLLLCSYLAQKMRSSPWMLNIITRLAASKYSTSTSNGLSVMQQSQLPPQMLPTGAPHGDLPDVVSCGILVVKICIWWLLAPLGGMLRKTVSSQCGQGHG